MHVHERHSTNTLKLGECIILTGNVPTFSLTIIGVSVFYATLTDVGEGIHHSLPHSLPPSHTPAEEYGRRSSPLAGNLVGSWLGGTGGIGSGLVCCCVGGGGGDVELIGDVRPRTPHCC